MLVAHEISVSFGAVLAVQEVSLAVGCGEVVGIIGPNGSGKTTFLNAVCGIVRAGGSLEVAGRPVALGKPRDVWRAGLARMFQAPQIIESLTSLENVLLSSRDADRRGLLASIFNRRSMMKHERRRWEMARSSLALVGLGSQEETLGGALTYGQRRLVELARALNGEPKVLLLDEPSAGLNDTETAALAELIVASAGKSIAVAVVDHKVDFIDEISSRIAVFDQGRLIAVDAPREIWNNERVVSAYLGTSHHA